MYVKVIFDVSATPLAIAHECKDLTSLDGVVLIMLYNVFFPYFIILL